jgi:hypothetical protein
MQIEGLVQAIEVLPPGEKRKLLLRILPGLCRDVLAEPGFRESVIQSCIGAVRSGNITLREAVASAMGPCNAPAVVEEVLRKPGR